MRCGCACGAYMIHSEGLEIACVCPECGARCNMCLGTNSVVGREQLNAYRRMMSPAGEQPAPAPTVEDFSARALDKSEYTMAAKVIRMGYAPAAWEFGVTRETAPDYPAFLDESDLTGALFGAFSGERMIGALMLTGAELSCLTVTPALRGQGAGAALLAYAESAAKQAGLTAISAAVIRANAKAREFLEKRGYVRTGETPGKSLNLTKILLKKQL